MFPGALLARGSDTDLKKFVNDRFEVMIKKYEIQSRMNPSMTLLACEDQSLFIRDSKTKDVAEVRLERVSDKENKDVIIPYCVLDDSCELCVHIAYVYGALSLYPAILNNLKIETEDHFNDQKVEVNA